jgi:hypothetical protein
VKEKMQDSSRPQFNSSNADEWIDYFFLYQKEKNNKIGFATMTL